MKITYDKEARAAYVYLTSPLKRVSKTVPFTQNIIVDFNKYWVPMGIEVLNCKFQSPVSNFLLRKHIRELV